MKVDPHNQRLDLSDKFILLFALVAIGFLIYILYFFSGESFLSGEGSFRKFLTFIPFLNACFNTLAACFLIMGIRAIKKKSFGFVYLARHKRMMKLAFLSSTCFLIGYLVYHAFHGDTLYLGQGLVRKFYFFILITHIVLSIISFPMVLLSFYWGLTNKIEKHRKLAKLTYPLWLYVSVTGVLIFIMLKVGNSGVES